MPIDLLTSAAPVQGRAFIQMMRALYGASNVLVGTISEVRRLLPSGAIVQRHLTDEDRRQLDAWAESPDIPWKCCSLTGTFWP